MSTISHIEAHHHVNNQPYRSASTYSEPLYSLVTEGRDLVPDSATRDILADKTVGP